MPLDHRPFTLVNFQGLYNRGGYLPHGHQDELTNFSFEGDILKKRKGFSSLGTRSRLSTRFFDILRGSFKTSDDDQGLLQPRRVYLSGESIYDANTQILSGLTGATDFSALNMNSRFYITGHDRNIGRGGNVKVYDGTDARDLGGQGPSISLSSSGFTPELRDQGDINANPFVPFNFLDIGRYIIAVSYRIDSFITKPGFVRSFYVSELDTNQLFLTSIPSIPAGVTDIILSMTRLFLPDEGDENNDDATNLKYARNYINYQFYFVPFAVYPVEGGQVTDRDGSPISELTFPYGYTEDDQTLLNTNRQIFFNGNLLFESTYLFDQVSSLKAGVGLADYNSRLVVWNGNRVWISRYNDPESFSSIDGYIDIGIEDPGTIKNCFAYQDILYVQKSTATYATQDNGEAPNTWRVVKIDAGLGSECHSIGRIYNFQGPEENFLFIANRQGLCLFDGKFSAIEASYKIKNLWDKIDDYSAIQVLIEPTKKEVYVFCSVDDEPQVLVMNYQKGLVHQEIQPGVLVSGPRWSVIQKTGNEIKSIGLSEEGELIILTSFSLSGQNFSQFLSLSSDDRNDDDISGLTLGGFAINETRAIESVFKSSNIRAQSGLPDFHYGNIRLNVTGAGDISLIVNGRTIRKAVPEGRRKKMKFPINSRGIDFDFHFTHDTINTELELLEASIFTRYLAS